jgi:anti-anti-sigma factor
VEHPWKYIAVEHREGVCCVHLLRRRLDEDEVYKLGDELIGLADDPACRKMALSLGPEPLECLYSVFLARLLTLRRKLQENGGTLVLYEVAPEARDVFEAARLTGYFTFAADQSAALAALAAEGSA